MPHLKWKAETPLSNTNAWWQLHVGSNSYAACRNCDSTYFEREHCSTMKSINNKNQRLLITCNNLRLSMLLGKCFCYLFNWISLASRLTSEVLRKRHELTWSTNVFSCWNDNHTDTNVCLNVVIYELHQSNWQARKHLLYSLALSEYCGKDSGLLLKFICFGFEFLD